MPNWGADTLGYSNKRLCMLPTGFYFAVELEKAAQNLKIFNTLNLAELWNFSQTEQQNDFSSSRLHSAHNIVWIKHIPFFGKKFIPPIAAQTVWQLVMRKNEKDMRYRKKETVFKKFLITWIMSSWFHFIRVFFRRDRGPNFW